MTLETFGTLTIGGSLAVVLVAVVSSLTQSLVNRLTLAFLAGAWIGLAVLLTATGDVNNLAILLGMFLSPILAIAALVATRPAFREALMSIPVPLMIGLNVLRVIGVSFLFLTAAGQLGGPFPYFAGIGDIITGAFALPVARYARQAPASDPRILAWNAFGFLDLVVAVALGVTSRNGSPIQLIHAGAGSAALATLPWSLVPLLLVPTFMIGHIVIFARARTEKAHNPAVQPLAV